MAIVAKFTRALPAPTATISGGFVFLLSAGWFTQADTGAAGSPIDGGTNSIANGGGDMQIFSDTAATTRLPIEVVTFVTGGSPQCQVWVRTPSYTAGDTITIGKDDTQSTQPAAGAAFGRNATWQDYILVSHDCFTDSTGNSTGVVTGTVTPVTGVFGDAGGGARNSSSSYVTFSGLTVGTDCTMSAWIDTRFGNSRFVQLGLVGSTGNQSGLGLTSSGFAYMDGGGTATTTASYLGGTSYEYFAGRVSTTLDDLIRVGNIETVTVVDATGLPSSDRARLFASADDTPFGGNGYSMSAIKIAKTGLTDDYLNSEYLNQNDADIFGTSSEYILVGGSGIELTPLNVNSSSLSINPTITFSSSLNLSPLQVDSSSISINPSISFSSALNLSPGEVNSLSVSLDPTILFSGALELSPVNVNSVSISIDPTIQYSSSLILAPNEVNTSSLAINPTIEYTSALVVAPQSVNSSSISINPQIEFKSIINLEPETVNSISIALNPTITTGEVQNIGNITAGFKDSGISVKYSINNITVNFK